MGAFESRERAFEAHFAYQEELAFSTAAYRNRLLALWAGERMGLSGGALEAYAKIVVQSSLSPREALNPVARIMRDLMAKGVPADPEEMQMRLSDCMAQAALRAA